MTKVGGLSGSEGRRSGVVGDEIPRWDQLIGLGVTRCADRSTARCVLEGLGKAVAIRIRLLAVGAASGVRELRRVFNKPEKARVCACRHRGLKPLPQG